MIPQVVLSPESFSTDVTAVGPLICVRSLMDQEVVGLGELSVTELADELLLLPAGRPVARTAAALRLEAGAGGHVGRLRRRRCLRGRIAKLMHVNILLRGRNRRSRSGC